MGLYILRRLLLMLPTLIGILAVVFFVMAAAPGGVGGDSLDTEGAQNQNVDAKRVQRIRQRRYGLDLPAPVQFGRWLNQVSPVGFRMSADITFTPEQEQEARAILHTLPLNRRDRQLKRAVDIAKDLAAYRGQQPGEAAQDLADSLANPQTAAAMLQVFDSKLDASEHARLTKEIQDAWGTSVARGQNEALKRLAFESAGASRIRFDRPAFKTPDLGETMQGRRVLDRLRETVPITLLLNLITIPLIYVIAIGTGVYAARHKGRAFDNISGIVLILLWSLPVIWVGLLAVNYLANTEFLRWFPTGGLHDLRADSMPFLPRWTEAGFERGYILDTTWHLVLPVLCLTYGGFAVASRVMRGAMLDNLSADFVRTARAKGVAAQRVLWSHVFRNSLLPLITMAAGILPALLGGSVVVERIFSINGMGDLAVSAAFEKDRELLMAITLIGGILAMISELIRDLCYAVADPRVSYD